MGRSSGVGVPVLEFEGLGQGSFVGFALLLLKLLW
jgi:hypothetical protein